MKSSLVRLGMMMIGLSLAPAPHASPPGIADIEIRYLLATVANSGCDFDRNGSWYDSKRAEEHLQDKYDNLAARDLIRP